MQRERLEGLQEHIESKSPQELIEILKMIRSDLVDIVALQAMVSKTLSKKSIEVGTNPYNHTADNRFAMDMMEAMGPKHGPLISHAVLKSARVEMVRPSAE